MFVGPDSAKNATSVVLWSRTSKDWCFILLPASVVLIKVNPPTQLNFYLLTGNFGVEESFVYARTVLLSAGEAEVLHGRGVLPTDRLRPVTPDPPHAPVKRETRQINT